jgi:hypothetical protein
MLYQNVVDLCDKNIEIKYDDLKNVSNDDINNTIQHMGIKCENILEYLLICGKKHKNNIGIYFDNEWEHIEIYFNKEIIIISCDDIICDDLYCMIKYVKYVYVNGDLFSRYGNIHNNVEYGNMLLYMLNNTYVAHMPSYDDYHEYRCSHCYYKNHKLFCQSCYECCNNEHNKFNYKLFGKILNTSIVSLKYDSIMFGLNKMLMNGNFDMYNGNILHIVGDNKYEHVRKYVNHNKCKIKNILITLFCIANRAKYNIKYLPKSIIINCILPNVFNIDIMKKYI